MKQLLFEFELKQHDEPLPFDEIIKEQVVAQIAHTIIAVYWNMKKLEGKNNDESKLSRYCTKCRKLKKDNKLSKDMIKKFESIPNWKWNLKE